MLWHSQAWRHEPAWLPDGGTSHKIPGVLRKGTRVGRSLSMWICACTQCTCWTCDVYSTCCIYTCLAIYIQLYIIYIHIYMYIIYRIIYRIIYCIPPLSLSLSTCCCGCGLLQCNMICWPGAVILDSTWLDGLGMVWDVWASCQCFRKKWHLHRASSLALRLQAPSILSLSFFARAASEGKAIEAIAYSDCF